MLEETECIFEHINQSSVFSDQAIFPACTTDVDTYVYLFPAVFGPLFILRHRDRYIWGAHYALWYSNRQVLTKRSIARGALCNGPKFSGPDHLQQVTHKCPF